MTAAEKSTLAHFLDLTDDQLRDGHSRNREDYAFKDDELPLPGNMEKAEPSTAIPLAYMVEEPSESSDTSESSDSAESSDSLKNIYADIAACKACGLAANRKNTVPGEGVTRPLVMIIGEGPGADEDAAGRPFVGRAGQLLDKMLESIGLSREKNCYIANMVKCRPPGNRDPEPDEIAACFPCLERQILLLKPKIILCAGRVASQNILKTSQGINALRGEFAQITIGEIVIPVLPTFHPSAILRDETLKRPAWEDLKLLKSRIEELD